MGSKLCGVRGEGGPRRAGRRRSGLGRDPVRIGGQQRALRLSGLRVGVYLCQRPGVHRLPVGQLVRSVRLGGYCAEHRPGPDPVRVCEVALVVGAESTPKGFFAPNAGERHEDPDWLRFHLVGATNPTYFALYARRRMALYGDTSEDFAAVKVKNSRHGVFNPNARYTKEYDVDDIANSPMVADPLRLLEICATSDGGAALVVSSLEWAASRGVDNPVRVSGISTVSPTYPNSVIELPYLASDSWAAVGDETMTFKDNIAARAYEEASVSPEDLDFAEVYDLSSAYELDWYEHIGLCERGDAAKLLRAGDTALGGRIPVNPSGGLGAFGEAVPAQAIAQVCEMVWQLRGEAGHRQVDGAKVGLSINHGMFGHGSSVICTR